MPRYRPGDPAAAVTPLPLTVGDRILFDRDAEWWTVAAVSDHFAACTRPATAAELDDPDDVDGDMEAIDPTGLVYTVLDWRSGVRGPCDLTGQSYGDGTYSRAECEAMLRLFELTDDDIGSCGNDPDGPPLRLEVSQRNHVPIRVRAHELAAVRG